ncbi:MAG: FkbM family methyltransferase [Saprospiraceae bacterium]
MIDTLARWMRRCIYSYRWRYIGYGLNSIISLLNRNKKYEVGKTMIHDYDVDLNIVLNPGEHIGNRIYFNGYYEGKEVWVLKKILKRDDVIVDVGANIGSWTLLFGKIAEMGKVYAIEPSTLFINLTSNIDLNQSLHNVDSYRLAFGNSKGLVIEDDTYRREHNEGMIRFLPGNTIEEPRAVEMTTLDDWAEVNNIQRLNWLKIDTEGMEYQILQGGAKTLNTFQPNLLLEVNNENLKFYNSSASALYALIYSHGYRYFYSAGKRGELKDSVFSADTNFAEPQNIFCSVNPINL